VSDRHMHAEADTPAAAEDMLITEKASQWSKGQQVTALHLLDLLLYCC
jgi:hypothetical protein